MLCCALCCVLCRPQDLLATAALYNTGDWVACSDALRAYVSTTITGERVLVCAGWGERGGGGSGRTVFVCGSGGRFGCCTTWDRMQQATLSIMAGDISGAFLYKLHAQHTHTRACAPHALCIITSFTLHPSAPSTTTTTHPLRPFPAERAAPRPDQTRPGLHSGTQ